MLKELTTRPSAPTTLRQVTLPASPFVSIIVPTYHEAENVRELVIRIADALQYQYPTYEIVLVDDNSNDGIDTEVGRLQDEGHPVRLVVRTDQRGLSTAVMRGFEESLGDILVCMDADLSHPPEKLPELIAAAQSPGTDFAIGSRYVPGGGTDSDWSWFRRWNSRVATWMARPFSTAKDPMAGFFAIPRDVYQRDIPLDPVGYKIGLEILVKKRCCQVREVPIRFADRRRGESKLTLGEQVRYLQHLKRLAEFKYGAALQLLVFCLVGLTGTIVDLTLYTVLLVAMTPVAAARAVAIVVAMTWNYLLDRHITWGDAEKPSTLRSYGRFVCSCSLGAILSWSLAIGLPACCKPFEAHLLGAAVVGIVAGTLVNFQLCRKWAFRSTGPSTD